MARIENTLLNFWSTITGPFYAVISFWKRLRGEEEAGEGGGGGGEHDRRRRSWSGLEFVTRVR